MVYSGLPKLITSGTSRRRRIRNDWIRIRYEQQHRSAPRGPARWHDFFERL